MRIRHIPTRQRNLFIRLANGNAYVDNPDASSGTRTRMPSRLRDYRKWVVINRAHVGRQCSPLNSGVLNLPREGNPDIYLGGIYRDSRTFQLVPARVSSDTDALDYIIARAYTKRQPVATLARALVRARRAESLRSYLALRQIDKVSTF